jgi:hypothetical protein
MMLGRLRYAVRSLAIFLGLTLASGLICIVLIPPLEEYSWAVYLFLWSGTTTTLAFLFLRERVDRRQLTERLQDWRRRPRVDFFSPRPRSAEALKGDAVRKYLP